VENFLFTSRNVGVRSKPPRKSLIGMVSPLDGEPSMIYRHLLVIWLLNEGRGAVYLKPH
jgi:hypothetical protein